MGAFLMCWLCGPNLIHTLLSSPTPLLQSNPLWQESVYQRANGKSVASKCHSIAGWLYPVAAIGNFSDLGHCRGIQFPDQFHHVLDRLFYLSCFFLISPYECCFPDTQMVHGCCKVIVLIDPPDVLPDVFVNKSRHNLEGSPNQERHHRIRSGRHV